MTVCDGKLALRGGVVTFPPPHTSAQLPNRYSVPCTYLDISHVGRKHPVPMIPNQDDLVDWVVTRYVRWLLLVREVGRCWHQIMDD